MTQTGIKEGKKRGTLWKTDLTAERNGQARALSAQKEAAASTPAGR
jgi:hypothetical protein